jgi:ABC-type uncharacterized transport system substrate-binding protein
VPADAFFAASRDRLAELAAVNAVPAIYSLRESAVSGGLMSYGNDLLETYRLIGTYAARIVKGEKSADLPVLQPTKFECDQPEDCKSLRAGCSAARTCNS